MAVPDAITIVLADLPALAKLYADVRVAIATPPTVVPPVDPTDAGDVDLAIAQALTPEFLGFIRTVRKQLKAPTA